MNLHPNISKAERVGRGLGIAYRGLLRREQQLRLWLVQRGLSDSGAQLFAWSMRLSLLVLLLSCSIFFAGLVAGLFLIGKAASSIDFSHRSQGGEWRHGDEGFGYYDRGVRTDFGRLFDSDK